MAPDREALRTTFDAAAGRYQEARPDYPPPLFDALIEMAGLKPGDRLLEVGCATGKATIPLARRGFQITCIELGTDLAAVARQYLAKFPLVTVVNGSFETWRPPPGEPFNLVFAATAWHWIDPDVRYRRAWDLLRPGGHLAIWSASHVIPEDGDPFFAELQSVYEEIGMGAGEDWEPIRPGQLPDSHEEIDATGLFETVAVRQFDWELTYDVEAYLRLLDTFSGHIAMQRWQRDRLYGEIRQRLAQRPDGRLRRHWGAVLTVAHRLGAPETRGLLHDRVTSA